ncbi:MAG TPA: tetratricopeptide repeat protein [Planctomycetaceae bacterium]|jgi:predicted O-linked N-acetylglucosamine transferase (SPINDLY family)|nr:tetratricopeptide repeat protein [Planctomycetaceae bacterium]
MSDSAIGETFAHALRLHRAGRAGDAARLYRQILADQADHAGALHLLGVAALECGQPQEALDWLQCAIVVVPRNAVYHLSLGQALTTVGRLEDAIDAFRQATEFSPDMVEAWFALGLTLQSGGRRLDAVRAYERVLELRPDHADACNNLGSTFDQLGELEKAIAIYRRSLELEPDRAMTLNNLGSALSRSGRLEEAIAVGRRVVARQPNFAAAFNNLGLALTSSRRLNEAVDALRRAVTLNPDFAEAWYNLANAFQKQAEFTEAAASYRRALELRSDWPEAYINLGNALLALREFGEAAISYTKALAVRPDDVDALNNLGSAQRDLGRVDEAIDSFQRCLSLRPDFHVAHCNLGNALRDSGQIEAAVASYKRAIESCPTDTISHSNLGYAVHFHPGYDGAAILQENLRWNAIHAARLWDRSGSHLNGRDPERRLRIGYIGADFRDHCQSLFTIPLFSRHDRERFEITCYANVPRPDSVTRQIMQCADRWRVIAGHSDHAVADEIRADRIDVLVDLTMHMSNGRPLVLARKPAPVQVAYLAYPGTTGLAAVDYRLTDPHLDPPGESDADYAEKSLRLPETFWCYDPLTDRPSPGPLPAIAAGGITFGCLNNFSKVNPTAVALWARVLNAVADSRLLLLSPRGKHREQVLDQLDHAKLEPSRIEFVEYRPRPRYLDLYRQIDVGLDTIPYNGHTTSLDSLWMGVPVVTRVGRTAVGRAGWSQLSNLGLSALAGWSDDEFVAIATGLARDLPRLGELRARLRTRMQQSPLMDAPRFARHVESAYRQMWREWCEHG